VNYGVSSRTACCCRCWAHHRRSSCCCCISTPRWHPVAVGRILRMNFLSGSLRRVLTLAALVRAVSCGAHPRWSESYVAQKPSPGMRSHRGAAHIAHTEGRTHCNQSIIIVVASRDAAVISVCCRRFLRGHSTDSKVPSSSGTPAAFGATLLLAVFQHSTTGRSSVLSRALLELGRAAAAPGAVMATYSAAIVERLLSSPHSQALAPLTRRLEVWLGDTSPSRIPVPIGLALARAAWRMPGKTPTPVRSC
jgi:hypothetical protein